MEAIGQLTGGNCHDFNNIMTVIIRYAGMLMNNLDEHDPQNLPISEISRAGERAATLTKQLLAFGRRQLLRPVGLDLNDHLRDLQQMLQTLLGDNISLELSLNATPCTIKIDPIQVQQIIINLAVNARDAMSEAGTLSKETIRLNKNVPEIVKKDGVIALCVMIAIHDSGHGIEKKTSRKSMNRSLLPRKLETDPASG